MDSRGIQHVWGTYCWRRTLEEGLGSAFDKEACFTRSGRGEEMPAVPFILTTEKSGKTACVTISSLLKESQATSNRSHVNEQSTAQKKYEAEIFILQYLLRELQVIFVDVLQTKQWLDSLNFVLFIPLFKNYVGQVQENLIVSDRRIKKKKKWACWITCLPPKQAQYLGGSRSCLRRVREAANAAILTKTSNGKVEIYFLITRLIFKPNKNNVK